MAARGRNERLHAIDHLKAAAIVAVVATHASRVFSPPPDTLEFWLTSFWTRFHVPSFLFASGLLYASARPVAWNLVGRRLARVLVPYLVASCVAQLAGVTGARSLGEVAFQLASASSLSVYYYVFVIACCVPLIWPLSRLEIRGVALVWLACLALTSLFALEPSARWWGKSLFWSLRDPLQSFQAGYFVSGWLVARLLPGLGSPGRNATLALAGAALAVAGIGMAGFPGWLPVPFPFNRMLYTAGVIGLVTLATRRRAAGPAIRFLSDATLGLYLYHRIFQALAQPWTSPLGDGPRMALQFGVGLAGAVLVLWGGRRLMGPARARTYLGA